MRIGVLGGTGFLGRHVCAALAAQGHAVTAVARHSPRPALPATVQWVQATLDDRVALGAVLAECDRVVHLAWDTTPGTSAMQPSLEALNNVLPTLRLLEELHRHPHCVLVFVSTGGALYADGATPSAESGALAPRSFYGAAKGAVELMLQAYGAQSGNPVVVLRPSNVYGPGQQPKRSFGIVPTLMQCARDGTPFELWGGPQVARDFLYAADFAALVSAVVARDWPRGTFARYNAGSGAAVPIVALCEAIERITGRDIHRSERPARPVDARRTLLDATLAARDFGWTASTPLEEGLAATWRWFRDCG